jgi:hypothetical protein
MENKKLKMSQINDNNSDYEYRRDSFSDKVCDDLCEILLSFLSFDDKIRFECISKRFQKLIFNKQNTFEVIYSYSCNNNTFNQLVVNYESFNIKAFESVLKSVIINRVVNRCQHRFH